MSPSAANAVRAPEPVSAFALDEVLDSVAKLVGLKADAKGIELLFDLPADLPTSLIGDAGRLRRVLIDIGTRAVRAAPSGDVVIGMRMLARDAAHAQLRFFIHAASVEDDSASAQGFEISRRLLDLMGSTLEAEEAPSGGGMHAFSVRFRIAERGATALVAANHERRARAGRRRQRAGHAPCSPRCAVR